MSTLPFSPTATSSAASAAASSVPDAMECFLDGILLPSSAAALRARAERESDTDPELIMLALRGLPTYATPTDPPTVTPEAAFVVAGGPPCLLREVLLPPYPLDDAPAQLYQAMDRARHLQSTSDFKAGVELLELVLRVWRKKHIWKMLRDEPDMTLLESLREDVRRTEERRLRAIAREEERLRKLAEEAEFARKMAEAEAGGEDGAAAAAAAEPQAASDSEGDSDSESDSDDESGERGDKVDGGGHSAAGGSSDHKHHHHHGHHHSHGSHGHGHKAGAVEKEQPEEVLEFPEVTPEEELEFLVFYYNALGSMYQSAAAAPASGGGKRISCAGGDGSGGVRWGRMRVIPCPADDPTLRAMLAGTKAGAQLPDRAPPPAGAPRAGSAALPDGGVLPTPFLEEEGSVAQEFDETDPLAREEEFMATSSSDLSNNSSGRALIALWQAKRAHDMYVQLKEGEKSRAAAEARALEQAARNANGQGAQDEDEDDDPQRSRASLGVGGQSGSEAGGPSNAAQTTLGHAAFAALNLPNLSLAALQAESKAMGLFGFPHVNAQVGASGSAAAATSLASRDRENNFLFWSTQPILAPPVRDSKQAAGGRAGSASSVPVQQPARAAAVNEPLPSAQLLNPYIQCSPADALTYSNLSSCLFHLGNHALALRCAHVALQIRSATLRPQDDEYIDVASSLNNLGAILAALNFFPQAHAHFAAALELLKSRLDPVHPRINLVQGNLTKVSARRTTIPAAPGLLQELRDMAESRERKEWEAHEKRMAKANKKGAAAGGGKGGAGNKPGSASARPSARKPGGKKDEEKPKEFHEDPRYFQPALPGQAPIVPPKVELAEGAAPPPVGTAAQAITSMPLRSWDVQMGLMQAQLLEFGPAKKKAAAAPAKGKKK